MKLEFTEARKTTNETSNEYSKPPHNIVQSNSFSKDLNEQTRTMDEWTIFQHIYMKNKKQIPKFDLQNLMTHLKMLIILTKKYQSVPFYWCWNLFSSGYIVANPFKVTEKGDPFFWQVYIHVHVLLKIGCFIFCANILFSGAFQRFEFSNNKALLTNIDNGRECLAFIELSKRIAFKRISLPSEVVPSSISSFCYRNEN